MTADDVVFSFKQHIANNVNRAPPRNITNVSAVDPTTVKFEMKAPTLNLPGILAMAYFPIFAKELYDNQDLFKKTVIGTGPFMLDFWEFQNRADWVRNPSYWQPHPLGGKYGKDPLPFLDKYTQQYYANQVAQNEAFFNGKIDNSLDSQPDPPAIKEYLQRVPNAILCANGYWAATPIGLRFQFKNALFKDKRVRQALSMSIDRQGLWENALGKYGAIGAAPVPFNFSGVAVPPPLNAYGANAQFNVDQAKQLLKDAGMAAPIKLQIYASAVNANAQQAALDFVVASWKKAGVAEATVVSRDAVVLAQDALQKSFPDILWGNSPVAAYAADAALSAPYLTDSAANAGSLADPEVDSLLTKMSAALDPKEVESLCRQLEKRLVDEVDHLVVGWTGGLDIAQPWLHGTVLSAAAHIDQIGTGNVKYVWIDQTAPDGRGGKPI